MSFVRLNVTVVVTKTPPPEKGAAAREVLLKSEKLLAENSATIDVWKEATSSKPTVFGSDLADAVLAIIGDPASKLPVRVGQGISLWLGKEKKDAQNVISFGNGVKTDGFKVLTAEMMPPTGDFVVPADAVHPVAG